MSGIIKIVPPKTKLWLLDQTSTFQNIRFEKTNYGLALFLDDRVQFVESEEKSFYNALAGIPFKLKKKNSINNALVLGGGNGLAARTVFKNNNRCRILVSEIDPYVFHACCNLPEMRKINEDSLLKVEVFIHDCGALIRQLPSFNYDLVISDLPTINTKNSYLYARRMFYHTHRVLKPGGIFSIYPGGIYQLIKDDCLLSGFVELHEEVVNLKSMGSSPIYHFRKK